MTSLRSFIVMLLLVSYQVSVPASAVEWKVMPEESVITFSGTLEGAEFEGLFHDFNARILFDPQQLAASRFEVSISTSSANTGSRDLNQGLELSEWLHSARHPSATFQSTQIRHPNEGRYQVLGRLTIKDTTHHVTLPFTWKQAGNRAWITGRTKLNRLKYGIGTGEWSDGSVVGLSVEVSTRLVLQRVDP